MPHQTSFNPSSHKWLRALHWDPGVDWVKICIETITTFASGVFAKTIITMTTTPHYHAILPVAQIGAPIAAKVSAYRWSSAKRLH
eukprot:2033022-Amphidinium_carterae.1